MNQSSCQLVVASWLLCGVDKHNQPGVRSPVLVLYGLVRDCVFEQQQSFRDCFYSDFGQRASYQMNPTAFATTRLLLSMCK